MFERVIQDHLALKERNARLDGKMPIEGYKDADPFENHPLFKSEEQALLEETMDGVDPDFSDETLDDIGVGTWPGQEAAPAAEANGHPQPPEVDDVPVEEASPSPRTAASGTPALPATSTGATSPRRQTLRVCRR